MVPQSEQNTSCGLFRKEYTLGLTRVLELAQIGSEFYLIFRYQQLNFRCQYLYFENWQMLQTGA